MKPQDLGNSISDVMSAHDVALYGRGGIQLFVRVYLPIRKPSAINVHNPPIMMNKHQYQYSDLVARPENVAYLKKQLEIACPKFIE